MGCNYTDADRFDAEVCVEFGRGPRVREIEPPDSWDEDLLEAWSEVEDLAKKLADQQDVIELSNGQMLFQTWPDWCLRSRSIH
jgi:sugar phosphate isomerase/epimerase